MLYRRSDFIRRADSRDTSSGKRTAYGIDTASEYGRIIHSKCFRRLQGKMQLFPPSTSPLLRNRLTHSLEVADIATRIVEHLNRTCISRKEDKIDPSIVMAVALAHDLGHPPFGHTGETVLAEIMADYGSFEGNAQTLRILTRLENRFVRTGTEETDDVYACPMGLNLLYRTIAGVVKYDRLIPVKSSDKLEDGKSISKGYYWDDEEIVERVRAAVIRAPSDGLELKTIECQIMDIADDIAYSTYDLEDCMIAGQVHPMDLLSVRDADLDKIAKRTSTALKQHGYEHDLLAVEVQSVYEMLFRGIIRKNTASDYRENSSIDRAAYLGWNYQNSLDLARNPLHRRKLTETLIEDAIRSVSLDTWNKDNPALTKIKVDPQQLLYIETLKHYNFINTIMSRGLQLYSKQAEVIIKTIFQTIADDNNGLLLPSEWRSYLNRMGKDDDAKRMRVICDYISSLTDSEAVAVYSHIRTPNSMPDYNWR